MRVEYHDYKWHRVLWHQEQLLIQDAWAEVQDMVDEAPGLGLWCPTLQLNFWTEQKKRFWGKTPSYAPNRKDKIHVQNTQLTTGTVSSFRGVHRRGSWSTNASTWKNTSYWNYSQAAFTLPGCKEGRVAFALAPRADTLRVQVLKCSTTSSGNLFLLFFIKNMTRSECIRYCVDKFTQRSL